MKKLLLFLQLLFATLSFASPQTQNLDMQNNRIVRLGAAVAVNDAPQLAQVTQADGWVNPNQTWTYASATTITIPTGGASRYSVGDKLKITQTTAKYFSVITVADTLLTVTAGSDYTVANAAITTPFYSHEDSPVAFPDYFNWTPTLTGFSADPTGTNYRFKIDGRRLCATVSQFTNGTSNATGFTITAPVVAKTLTNGLWGSTLLSAFDNGALIGTDSSPVFIGSAGTVFTLHPTQAFGNWTNANGKRANFSICYEIG